MGSICFCDFIFRGEVSGLVRELRRHKSIGEAQKKCNQKERQKREEMIKASNNPVYKKIMSRYSAWRDMFDNMG